MAELADLADVAAAEGEGAAGLPLPESPSIQISSSLSKMQSAEVRAHLFALALTPTDAARLLGVGLRSVRRWTQPRRLSEDVSEDAGNPPHEGEGVGVDVSGGEGEGGGSERIPGPAQQALRAWLKLHRLGQHWRPDGLPLQHIDVAAAIERVRARAQGGGRATSWDIDVENRLAVMKGHRVSFVWLAPGRFALQTYCRPAAVATPGETHAVPAALIDDACACIARRLAGEREPPLVRLVLGEPVLVDDVIELRDPSLSPIVACTLSLTGLRRFLERDVTGTAALGFVRRNHAALADLASEVHARRAVQNQERMVREQGEGASPIGLRLLDIDAADLGLVRSKLISLSHLTSGASMGQGQRGRQSDRMNARRGA
jgi:hypothetical protein